MKLLRFTFLSLLLFLAFGSYKTMAQALTGTKTVCSSGCDYTTLALAVADLNTNGVGAGGVVFNISAGHTETLSARLNIAATGTVSNTIVFQKSGVGANPTLTSFIGTATSTSVAPDGMVSITGGDYITIDGINLTESGANTTATTVMEYGYGLFVASATDGAQNNTIKNCNITLNRVQSTAWTVGNVGSEGIAAHHTTPGAATTAVVPSAASGSHSNNKFYANTIQNCHAGIALVGYAAPSPYTLGDTGNDIGGSILANGNSVLNFGGGAAAATASAGIFVSNQWGVNVSYNTVNNNNGSGVNHPNTLRGIFLNAGSTAASATCNNNSVTIKGGGTTSQVAGIENGFGGLAPASNTISISNNTVSGEYLTATTGAFYGIYNNSSAPTTLNIIGNTVQNINYSTLALTGTGAVYGIFISGTPTGTTNQYVRQNTVNNIARFGTTGGTTIGIYSSSLFMTGLTNFFRSNTVSNLSIDGTGTASIIYGIQTATGTIRCDSNVVYNLSVIKTTGTSALYGIYNISSPTNETYDNNEVYNLSHAGTGITYGIYANTTTGVRSIARNKIYSISSNGLTVAGILSTSSSPNINSNKIYNIQSNSSGVPTVSGIVLSSLGTAGTANIYNNVIGGIYAPNASFTTEAALVRGINITSTTASSFVNIYYNTVYLDATSAGTNFGSAALFVTGSTTATSSVVNLRNNILINESTPAGTGLTVAYRRGTGTAGFLANYASTSNNNLFYAGAPSATNLIYYDGTSSAQSITDYKTGVFTAGTLAPRDANSVSESITFASTTGSNAQYLELSGAVATQAESGAAAISSYTDSYNGVAVRTGYPLVGQTNGGGSAPDMGAYEGDYTPSDQTGPSISYTALSNTASTSARTLTASISDPSGVATTGLGLPVLYYKINSGAYTSATGSYVSGNNYSFSFGSGVVVSDVVSYYIVAQDNSASNNTSVYPSTGASGLSTNPPAASTAPTSPSTYSILPSISGSFDVGATKTSPNYATLTAAMADINAKVITGAVVLNLDNDYDPSLETFPIVIGENGGSSGTNTLTIKPKSGVTETITGSSATAIFSVNGADYLIIDGSNNGTTSRDLTITNSGTATPNVILVASLGTGLGATNNVFKNCVISTGVNATLGYGISIGGASAGSNGADNDNTTIQNNSFSEPGCGIWAYGTANNSTGGLDNLVITGNTIASSGSALAAVYGIRCGNSTGASITQNTVSIETSGASVCGISLETGFVSSVVSKNLISKAKSTSVSGLPANRGIAIATGQTGSNVEISNNVIYNVISFYATTNVASNNMGICVGASGVSTTSTTCGGVSLYYNSVNLYGSVNRAGAVLNYGVFINALASSIDIRNNVISNSITNVNAAPSTSKNYAIYSAVANTAYTNINYNDYFVSGAQGVLGFLSSDIVNLTGIQTGFGSNLNSVNADPLFNSSTNLIAQLGSPLLAAGTPIVGITTDYIGTTRSVTTPTIGAYETGSDGTAPTITYTALNNVVASSSRTLTSFATITDVSGINTTAGTRPRIYYKKSTDDNTYVGNTSSDNGWKYVESSNTSSPFSFTMDFSIINGGSVSGGQTIQYFVVAQDLASTANVALAKSGLGFTAAPSSVALAVGQFPLTGTPDQFSIVSALATTLTVGSSGADYTSLSGSGGLFEAINNGILSGNTTVTITSDLSESGANSLNSGGMGGYSLSIQPASATIYNIENSADIAANGMIVLFADNITIDGRFSGAGNYLRFQNTHSTAASAQAAIYLNNCTNITIRNCTIQGNTSGTGNGVVLIGSGTNASVTNITLLDNVIKEPTTGLYLTRPAIGIFLKSTQCGNITIGNATVGNQIINCTTYGIQVGGNVSASSIRNNNFYNTTSLSATYYGVYMSAGTDLTIQDNHFYGAGTSGAYSGIYLSSASAVNMTISGNFIGGGDVSCGGTAMPISGSGLLYPMYVSIGASNNSIQGNTIQNFNITGTNTTYLMYVLGSTGASIGTVTANVIGHNSTSGSITRNSASGITYGIYGTATGGLNIQNNIVANFDFTATTSSSNLIGIYITGSAVNTVSNNVVHDIFNNSSSTSSTTTQSLIGISLTGASASGAGALDGNTVYNLSNNYALTTNNYVSGIVLGSTSFNGTVQKNKIYALINKSTGTAPILIGFYLYDASTSTATTIANNQISLNNTGGGDKCGVWGIRENTAAGDILNIWYNTIYIGGTANAATTLISSAIAFQLANTAVSLKNNILYNERTGGTATTGQGNYCLAIDLTTGYSISNNLFITPSDARVGRFGGTADINVYGFVDFNTNASQTNSVYTTSVINPAASFFTSTSTANLITSNCWADNAAAAVALTTDFTGTTRNVSTPDIGAHEFSASLVQWKGASTDWQTNTNWCYNTVPSSSTDIEIPATTNDPILGATASCKNINIATGEILSLNGNTLNIYGEITGSGTLKGNGSLSIQGSGTFGTVNFDQTTPGTTNKLANLTYNRSSQTITLGNALQISGVVTPTAGTLATGGNLTLLSATGADASIAAGSGSYITGAVTVQRYIPAATSGRKYRYLAAPFATGPSIASSWQQQIHITGAAGVSAPGTPCPTLSAHGNGFDASTYNNGSMLTFNEATATVGSGSSNASGGTIYNNAWTSVANTNSTNLSAGLGYNVFVRGARSQGCGIMDAAAPTSPTDVTLSATGTVTTGSFTYTGVTYNASNGDGWNLVGNPYPSAIDWDAGSWTKTNILPTIWVYNPASNNYGTYNTSTGGVSGGSNIIPSGTAFFVHATGTPSLGVTEAAKTSSYPGTLLLKNKPFDFRITISNASNVKDEHLIALNRTGASDLFDPITDAEKMHNPNNVNVYSIDGANKKYAINAIAKIEDQEERIIPLGTGAANPGTYQLSIAPVDLPYYYYVFLRDHFLKTEMQVESGHTLTHNFQVTADSASFKNGRFDLFISNNRPHSTGLTNSNATTFAVNVFPNPSKENITVNITGNIKNVHGLNLYNAMGQLITQIANPVATTQIDLSTYPAGIYFLQVISEAVSVETIKLIKN